MDSAPERIYAPFTDEQVLALNAYQVNTQVHPYTCGQCGGHTPLVARNAGWLCAKCDYTQDWAHAQSVQIGQAAINFIAMADPMAAVPEPDLLTGDDYLPTIGANYQLFDCRTDCFVQGVIVAAGHGNGFDWVKVLGWWLGGAISVPDCLKQMQTKPPQEIVLNLNHVAQWQHPPANMQRGEDGEH